MLRKWAERGKLTVVQRDGRNGYLLSEVFSVALSST
nr:MAG TPA: hypothetical protein [Caudoviricetes sp.]